MNTGNALYVGLMSGTSVDAIDSAILQCSDSCINLIATHQHPIPPETKRRIAAISHSAENEIERLGVLDRELGFLFAQATLDLLDSSGIEPDSIRAIGSHGQTIRHRPPSASVHPETGFTLQIGDPNTIAEVTGITTIADFRRRDIAAGGEGAPLASAFHAVAFAKNGKSRAIVNIGGIANVTFLDGSLLRGGFDTGPGNTLLDAWVLKNLGTPYDDEGQWAHTGQVQQDLLSSLLSHSYFRKQGSRSTGKEVFNLAWLEKELACHRKFAPEDVQATLVELTCSSICSAIKVSQYGVSEIYICGGGAHNTLLMSRLQQQMAPAEVQSTAVLGLDPDWVEAATFAWLARQTLEGLAGNAPAVTGASGLRVLGGIYPGAPPSAASR